MRLIRYLNSLIFVLYREERSFIQILVVKVVVEFFKQIVYQEKTLPKQKFQVYLQLHQINFFTCSHI